MDVEEGFIVGIYNYCDRWCETCAFTSRCGVFADRTELEARHDSHLKAICEAPPLPRIAPEHESIESRAHSYADAVHAWLQRHEADSPHPPSDPRAVVTWFQYSIPAKIHRALRRLACHDAEEDWPADHEGSAKVALLGIERSHAAWLEAAHVGIASPFEIAPLIADLIWLSDELERVFPTARAFVRPGLDEPDEVAKLLASEGGRL